MRPQAKPDPRRPFLKINAWVERSAAVNRRRVCACRRRRTRLGDTAFCAARDLRFRLLPELKANCIAALCKRLAKEYISDESDSAAGLRAAPAPY